MNQTAGFPVFLFETERLRVEEVGTCLAEDYLKPLLQRAVDLLSPAVVAALPQYFQGITTLKHAEQWFKQVCLASRLLVVTSTKHQHIIGFIFIYEDGSGSAHIGYLLGEEYWRQGLAFELLRGLVAWASQHCNFTRLLAGVEVDNMASKKLLTKLGFQRQPPVVGASNEFYQYSLS
ncbi:GNAT family N-acetyltransferase [Agarivorans sp. TSD2052]|uniref:GNAT family N-acetyltransferase n=1 Tax=Agarivorans sp. TSD2052 TaxID=2937286 RepID=UPI0020106616|nr:GNAT family N-acetyltransferase [Agarivorans sp. TSD2052]UPW17073.1 GNAT family N-acetyltransferase [Agarivorans sp. TSD2052]